VDSKKTLCEGQPTNSAYLLDNAAHEARGRFDALSALFDPGTIRHLEDRGIRPGWQCLEVGGGAGSIAAWLATRVGPTGHVLVTDIDPRFLEPLDTPNVEVRRHNIVTDPLPDAAFDLIHVRAVLLHLPEREQVLTRLVAALKPGGWLIDEDLDSVSALPNPTIFPGEILLKTQLAMMRLMDDRGVERRFGRTLFGRLRALGLVAVDVEARMSMWHSGSPGAALMRLNFEQLREAMISGGYITEEEIARDIAQLEDSHFMAPSPILWAAWGQRALAERVYDYTLS
jgi:2-polyprenyl-3-methyl-5-hydroxy-6-metoxy-1,4-benzoquinol methylase